MASVAESRRRGAARRYGMALSIRRTEAAAYTTLSGRRGIEPTMAGRVAICGSITADIFGYGPRLPRPGESVLGSLLLVAPGGKGANQAVAAARMGASVTFAGARGDDAY